MERWRGMFYKNWKPKNYVNHGKRNTKVNKNITIKQKTLCKENIDLNKNLSAKTNDKRCWQSIPK